MVPFEIKVKFDQQNLVPIAMKVNKNDILQETRLAPLNPPKLNHIGVIHILRNHQGEGGFGMIKLM